MEEEKNHFYPLFEPLEYYQTQDILSIWNNNHTEYIYHKKRFIRDYCEEKECDFLSALKFVYDYIASKYFCCYTTKLNQKVFSYTDFSTLRVWLRKKIVNTFNNGRSLTKEQNKLLNDMLELIEKEKYYDLKIANLNGHCEFIDFDIEFISRIKVEKEEIELVNHINSLLKERRKDCNKYYDNSLNSTINNIEYKLLSDLEKQMYLPSDKLEALKAEINDSELKISSLKSLFNIINSETTISVEIIDNIISEITNEYSLVLIKELINDTKQQIKDRITFYIVNQKHKSEEERDMFFENFDDIFQKGHDDYINNEFFDINNLKLTNLFIKDEFRELKFILDRLREIRDEKSGVENITISNNTSIEKIVENPSIENNKKENNSINIDIEAFKAYFKVDFTTGDEDSKFKLLIDDMRGSLPSYKKKQITALALLIRKSGKIHHNKYSHTFSKWLVEFCGIINCEVPTYKENQVKNESENLKATYYYLFS